MRANESRLGQSYRNLWTRLEKSASKPSDLTRYELINLCVWNDPNGSYTDEDSVSDGMEPATKDELVELVARWLLEAKAA